MSDNWGPWQLHGVTVYRESRDDATKVQAESVTMTLAFPPLAQCMHTMIEGDQVFVVCMGQEVPVPSMEVANILRSLFEIQYKMGVLAAPVCRAVHEVNASPQAAHSTPPP